MPHYVICDRLSCPKLKQFNHHTQEDDEANAAILVRSLVGCDSGEIDCTVKFSYSYVDTQQIQLRLTN